MSDKEQRWIDYANHIADNHLNEHFREYSPADIAWFTQLLNERALFRLKQFNKKQNKGKKKSKK